mgnify:CR=1 FL=1
MILLNQITSAVLQLLIFSGVPLVWYILTQKRVKGFFKWLGISTAAAPPLNAMFCILAGFLAALFLPYMWLYRSGNLNYQGFYSGCVSADRLEYRNICSYTDMGDRADFVVGGNPVPGVSL